MISIVNLFESDNKKPYRTRVEVFVLKDDKLMVGTSKGWNGYVIPGGGVDPGESLEDAAKREVLEELGISIKNLRIVSSSIKIDYNDTYSTDTPPHLIDDITRAVSNYSGIINTSFIADFDSFDKSLWNKKDSYNVKEIEIKKLIDFFNKSIIDAKKKNDSYGCNKNMNSLKILKKLNKKI